MKETLKHIFPKALSCLLILICSTPVLAGILLSGKAPAYPNQELLVFTYLDHISQEKDLLAQVEIDEQGRFEVGLDWGKTDLLILRIGRVSASMYAEAGGEYTIVFPEYPTDQALSFHKQNAVDLFFENLDPLDINAQIGQFNGDYDRFFADNYLSIAQDKYQGNPRYKRAAEKKLSSAKLINEGDTLARKADVSYYDLVKEFEQKHLEELDDRMLSAASKTFMQKVVRYSSALLKLSAGVKRQKVYEEYLFDEPLSLSHPDYCDFVVQFYRNEFIELTDLDPNDPLVSALSSYQSYAPLEERLRNLDGYGDNELRALSSLVMLRAVFKKKVLSKNLILKILSEIGEKQSALKPLAELTVAQLSRNMKGAPVPNFTLVDQKNNRVSLSDMSGQWVYLSFTAAWCPSCKLELDQMVYLTKKFKGQVTFVSVAYDEDFGDFKQFLRDNRDYDWTFLYAGYDHLLKEKIGVYALPHFMLIRPDGKLAESYTQKPSEGIGAYLEKKLKAESGR